MNRTTITIIIIVVLVVIIGMFVWNRNRPAVAVRSNPARPALANWEPQTFPEAIRWYDSMVTSVGVACDNVFGKPTEDIREYIINLQDLRAGGGITRENHLRVYKGINPTTNDMGFVMVATSGTASKYYAGSVLCPRICGQANAEICNQQLGSGMSLIGTDQTVARDFIGTQVGNGVVNAIGVPDDVVQMITQSPQAKYLKIVYAPGETFAVCFLNLEDGSVLDGFMSKSHDLCRENCPLVR